MSFKDVLKVFKLERDLTDDETALLNTLRGMSESERELLAETLGPVVAKKKLTTTRVIEKCATEGCGLTRRARVHKDANADGYHVFSDLHGARKSARAESLAGVIKKKTGDKEPRCVVCFEVRDHTNHDLDNGGHEFTTDLAGRVNETLDKHNDSVIDNGDHCLLDSGDGPCYRSVDDNVHHKQTDPDYHEFVGSETAMGVGGD